MSTATEHGHRSARIDGLRALAALSVLVIHSAIVGNNTWLTPLFVAGAVGVYLFFLISGYVISLAWDTASDKDLASFYIRRAFRVAPLYYVMLILTYVMSWSNSTEKLNLVNFLLHVPFAHGFSTDYRLAGIGPMWTLTSELMFYALFPFLVCLRTRSLVIIFVLSFAFLNNTTEIANRVLQLPWLSLEPLESLKFFVGGMLVYRHRDILSRDNILSVSQVMAWLFVAALAMACIFHALDRAGVAHIRDILNEYRNVWTMHEYFLILAFPYLVLSPSWRMKIIFDNSVARYLGMISYSIYLWQMPVVFEMLKHTAFAFPVAQIVLLLLTIAISSVSYHLIEQPFNAIGRKLGQAYARRPFVERRIAG